MTIPFATPKPTTKMVNPDGTITREWFLYFSTILQTLGGPPVQAGVNQVGTVSNVSIVNSNGFNGIVNNSSSTPAITIETTVNGILAGNGSSVSAAIPVNFPTLNQNTTGTAAGLSSILPVANGGTGVTTSSGSGSIVLNSGAALINPTINHAIGSSSTPSIAAGSGAGTGPTLSIAGTDLGFKVSLTTGTATTSSSVLFTVTFNAAYGASPYAVFSSSDTAAASISVSSQLYSTTTATTFTLNCGAIALNSSTLYVWNVILVQ